MRPTTPIGAPGALAGLMALALGILGSCAELPTEPGGPNRMAVRGVNFVDWTADGYRSQAALESLDILAGTGANRVAVLVTAYQSDVRSSEVRANDPRTPSPSSVRAALRAAAARGLRTTLKPHVDLDDGTWRARIVPSDPPAWFHSYQDFILPLAEAGEAAGVAQFMVGTELAGTLRHDALWRETLRRVRDVFSGELVYAASWDEAGHVPFWDALDLVGVDFYYPVAMRSDAGRREMLAGWQPWLSRLRLLHQQTGLPLVLSEIGCRSVDGAAMFPSAFGDTRSPDPAEQADFLWAALAAVESEPWITGIYWWNWPAAGTAGANDTDFSPIGKPAQRVMEEAWRDAP